MKFRKDFVTNSSSSSYICEICGRNESGWDLGLSEIEMVECVNGHIFCQDEMFEISRETYINEIKAYQKEYKHNSRSIEEIEEMELDELENYFFDECEGRYSLPEICCPICQFAEYSESDMAKYLEKKYSIGREEVFAIVKEQNKRRKKLYDSEYIAYVGNKHNLNPIHVADGWKSEFESYAKFKEYLRN